MNKTTEQSRLEILICYRGDYAPHKMSLTTLYERSKSK